MPTDLPQKSFSKETERTLIYGQQILVETRSVPKTATKQNFPAHESLPKELNCGFLQFPLISTFHRSSLFDGLVSKNNYSIIARVFSERFLGKTGLRSVTLQSKFG